MAGEIPIYRFIIRDDDSTGVNAVALVDEPAIELNWQAFKKDQSHKFSADVEKRIISGPLMIADLPIYRRDKEYGEYYCVFTAEDIANCVRKFFRKGNIAEVNMMHDSNSPVDDCYLFESFIIDPDRGIHSPTGYDLTPGSWFGSYKIENQKFWDDYIKTGKFKGFSVEGFFGAIQWDSKEDIIINKAIEIIKRIRA